MYLGYLYNRYKEKRLKKKLGFCGIDNNILQPYYCGFHPSLY